MCVLVDHQIADIGQLGHIVPFIAEQVNPASYDLRIGAVYIDQYTGETLSSDVIELHPHSYARDMWYDVKRFVMVRLLGGILGRPKHKASAILATTIETVNIPKHLVGDVKLKSSLARHGLDHALAGYIDPGFNGQITLELHSHRYVKLRCGQRIVQIVFTEVSAPPVNTYDGNYQNQVGPTKSVLER